MDYGWKTCEIRYPNPVKNNDLHTWRGDGCIFHDPQFQNGTSAKSRDCPKFKEGLPCMKFLLENSYHQLPHVTRNHTPLHSTRPLHFYPTTILNIPIPTTTIQDKVIPLNIDLSTKSPEPFNSEYRNNNLQLSPRPKPSITISTIVTQAPLPNIIAKYMSVRRYIPHKSTGPLFVYSYSLCLSHP